MSESSSLLGRQGQPPVTLVDKVVEIVVLSVTTAVLLIVFIINGLASTGIDGLFANGTGEISDEFSLQITPAGWTFAIWGVIYAWQALWILYAWSFVFRPSTPRTVSWISLLLYTCNNVSNIIWIFTWGNEYPQVAFPFIFLMWAFLVAATAVEAHLVYKVTPAMQSSLKDKIDLWISRLLVTNGLVIYTTWLTVATHINFGIVLQYYSEDSISPITASAAVQWLLSVAVVAYFVLENTVLDRYARFIFMVYPVLIWALTGVMSAHWEKEDPNTSPVLTLLLLLLSIAFLLGRIALVSVFAFFRPLTGYSSGSYRVSEKSEV